MRLVLAPAVVTYAYISGIILRSMADQGFAGSAIWDPGRPGSLVVVVVVVVMVVVIVVVVRKEKEEEEEEEGGTTDIKSRDP